jgi:hypothetical protein
VCNWSPASNGGPALASWIEYARKPYEAQHTLVGLSDAEVLELTTSFRFCGFWRFEIESGHFFGTPDLCRIFGLPRCDGPIDLLHLSSRIHPDDLSMMMETFERASAARLTYHNLYRIKTDAESYRYVRSVGKFRADEGEKGVVIGMTYELFPQTSTVGFIPDDDLLKG